MAAAVTRGRSRGGAHRVVIALGSNLGDRLDNLQGAVDALFDSPGLRFVAVSPVFETSPVGGPDQPDYLNAVLAADTTLPARAVLERCQGVEASFGRTRTQRWGPRTLDLDIIVYGDDVSRDPELTIPHPRAHERAFVLAPWHEVDPAASIPGHGPVTSLLAAVSLEGVHRWDGGALHAPA
ncbi:MAG TPA: 2-amino-4-hydroxy-6-hydroxymethyldihydropteridine diphosphokinase [Streptosporangiaceae bacterium]|nr:2-amino-4-hydroxy-6-hydroxymethyldihydropteridine diphosphokinase [Streptosporangiaceae bacterium]